MSGVKRAAKRVITGSRPLLRLLGRFGVDMPRVLVYHRFAPPGVSIPHRVSADVFAWQLDAICRDFRVISLAECVEHFALHSIWPHKAVVLTIDDGYRDMYQWAYPELLKRKLPATFFVTTRFIDGDIWLWPDRLEYALSKSSCRRISIAHGSYHFDFLLQDEQQQAEAWKAFSDHCIGISDSERQSFIANLESLLNVSPPSSPLSEYSASSWDELREMHRNGIEIGSHTTNHPILSKIDPSLLGTEIIASKHVIERQLGDEISSFCYPNSAPGDINDTVVSTVCNAGFSGAVFGTDLSRWEPYRIPRMGVTNDRNDFLWKVYGGELISSKKV